MDNNKKKMKEAKLKVIQFELSDVIVASEIKPPQSPTCYYDGDCFEHQTCGLDKFSS